MKLPFKKRYLGGIVIICSVAVLIIAAASNTSKLPADDCMKAFPEGTPRAEFEAQWMKVCHSAIEVHGGKPESGYEVTYRAVLQDCKQHSVTVLIDKDDKLVKINSMDSSGRVTDCPDF